MAHPGWFEISHDGWRRLSASRPLGRLLLEAVQNAFDARASAVEVELEAQAITVMDDGADAVDDERLLYTVFLSEKPDDPTRRGRMGRGLKELIGAMDSALVETVGRTVEFTPEGRESRVNARPHGTKLVLRRAFSDEELAEAKRILRMCIPPKRVSLRVDGRAVRRPRLALTLSSVELETVVIADGVERAATRATSLSLYTPRRGEQPHLLEMGLPVQPWNVPWHVDVHQRVPLVSGRDGAPERFDLSLKAALLEALIHSYLDKRDLRADWVQQVLTRWPMRTAILDAYVSKVFPRGAVLGGTSRANDRARQLGAHVIEASVISHGAYLALERVLETADDYVRRRAAEFQGEAVEPDETQERFATAVRWLARRIAGRVVRVRFFARDPNDAGLLEDATTDAESRIISFNVRGPLRFDDILEPATLGVVLHEIAHLETPEHDQRFVDRLQLLAGQTAKLFAEQPGLAGGLRRGDPGGKGSSPRE